MIPKIKKKHIEIFLQDTPDFDAFEKNWDLEQIMTPPSIAAEALHKLLFVNSLFCNNFFYFEKNENNYDFTACDLGCGTGMLSAGLFFIGARFTIVLFLFIGLK